jgi:hypothetical protein
VAAAESHAASWAAHVAPSPPYRLSADPAAVRAAGDAAASVHFSGIGREGREDDRSVTSQSGGKRSQGKAAPAAHSLKGGVRVQPQIVDEVQRSVVAMDGREHDG